MPGRYYSAYLLVWVVVGFVTFWKAGSSRWNGVGLALGFFINMALLHWFAALVCYLPWYTPKAGMYVNEQGFEMSTLGIVAFAIGCFVIAPFFSPNSERAETRTAPAPRVIRSFLIVGIVSYLAMAAGLRGVATIGAIVGTGTYFVLVAICIGLWDAVVRGHRKRFYALLASTLLMPAFTILTQGFLGYGVGYAILILSVFIALYKHRGRLLLAALPVGFVALSFFVTYMRYRAEIREQVWYRQGSGGGVGKLVETCQKMEWFDPFNPQHLERIDGRLNLNELVGTAVSHLALTHDFARGETIWMGVFALIPRAIWSDKTVSAGSMDLVSRYTGLTFAYGTSVGMGLIFEFYVNFGAYGVFAGLLVMGVLVGVVDRRAGVALRSGSAFDFALWFLMGTVLLNVGGSLVEITPGLVIPVVVTSVLRHLLGPGSLANEPESSPGPMIDQLNS